MAQAHSQGSAWAAEGGGGELLSSAQADIDGSEQGGAGTCIIKRNVASRRMRGCSSCSHASHAVGACTLQGSSHDVGPPRSEERRGGSALNLSLHVTLTAWLVTN